jgi:hypothetical protein
LEFAREMTGLAKPRITNPAVVGAVIDLGVCLNLLDSGALEHVKRTYESLAETYKKTNQILPINRPLRKTADLIWRNLDCLVIQTVHSVRAEASLPSFETVRSVFVEGEPLYPNAGFHAKNHIQICVRDPKCIKGVFRVDIDAIESD